MTEKEIDKFHRDADTQGFGYVLLAVLFWIFFGIGVVVSCIWAMKFINWLYE